MRRRTGKGLLLTFIAAGATLASAESQAQPPSPLPPNAAKAAASYHAVTRAIDNSTRPWDQAGPSAPVAAPGWRAFFDALKAELASYSVATAQDAKLASLGRIHQMDLALWGFAWTPAVQVRTALDDWLTPRVRIAWAERRLSNYVDAHRGDSAGSTEHSPLWKKFVDDDLGVALATYEGAKTVQARRAALKKLNGVLASLRRTNQATAWPYSAELQASLDGLYNLPNLDVSADATSVSPFLANDVLTTGPVAHGGYVSEVVAGPRTGFGLLPSDEGIAFYNSQLGTTSTPITDFQNQLEQDKKGRKVAKLYAFSAESHDTPNLTITAIIRPSTGLSLASSYAHNINAAFGAVPIQGKGLARGVLAILGLNRQKIVDKVGQQAYSRIAQGVVTGSEEEAALKLPEAQQEQNVKLSRVLIGNDTVAIKDFRITELSLRSRPQNALISGKVGHSTAPEVIGADMPQPRTLIVPNAGVSADLHVNSVFSNVVAGLLEGDEVKGVDNLMIVTKAVQPGQPASEGITVGKNVDYATFVKNIDEARAANNPKVTAIRFKKPSIPPEFAADERGFLVVIVKDFRMDVPAPPGAEKGGLLGAPSKVLRFLVPTAEFILSYKVVDNGPNPPTEIDAKVEDFVPSGNSKVQTLFDDENKPTTMGPFQANFALLGFKNKLTQVPIKVPLTSLNIPGFSLAQVSPLDPSGWMRVVLLPNGPINLKGRLTPTVAPGPSPGPIRVPAESSPVAATSATRPSTADVGQPAFR